MPRRSTGGVGGTQSETRAGTASSLVSAGGDSTASIKARSFSELKLPRVDGARPLDFQDFYSASFRRAKDKAASSRLQQHRGVTSRLERVASTPSMSRLQTPVSYSGTSKLSLGTSSSASPNYLALTAAELEWVKRVASLAPTPAREEVGTMEKNDLPVGGGDVDDDAAVEQTSRQPSKNLRKRASVFSRRDQARLALASKIERALGRPGLMQHIDDPLSLGDPGGVEERSSALIGAFKRFLPPLSTELGVEQVPALLRHLGHWADDEAVIKKSVHAVTEFPTIDFYEFLKVLDVYLKAERTHILSLFKKFDADSSGKISRDELASFLVSIGVMPLWKTLEEATKIADKDQSSNLDFQEFHTLLFVYRSTEGFTSDEVEQLRGVFERFALTPPAPADDEVHGRYEEFGRVRVLPPAELWQALLFNFRPHTEEMRQQLASVAQVASIDEAQTQNPANFDAGVDFLEFLRIARIVRESEVKRYKEVFLQYQDVGDCVDVEGLREIIKSLGMLPLQSMINDFMTEADTDGNGTLDFVEFSNLMIAFRSTQGFTKPVADELRTIFDCYAITLAEDRVVSTLQLIDVLKHLGKQTKLNDIKHMIATVDYDSVGYLDVHKFLHLMRLLRDKELTLYNDVFKKHAHEVEGEIRLPSADNVVDQAVLLEALAKLGLVLEEEVDEDAEDERSEKQEVMEMAVASDATKLDGFVEIVDSVQKNRALKIQRVAGFSPEEVASMRETFDSYDDDHNQYVEHEELVGLLRDLKISMRTKDEQASVLNLLADARRTAAASGIPESELPPAEECRVTFPWLLHLFRMLQTRLEKDAEALEEEAAKETGFSNTEVCDFREIFNTWKARQTRPGGVGGQQSAAESGTQTTEGAEEPTEQTHINENGVRRVLRSLKVVLDRQQVEQLGKKMAGMDSALGAAQPQILFPDFLRLMHWMMKVNFAGINNSPGET